MNVRKLVELASGDPKAVLEVMDITLSQVAPDISAHCEWKCSIEGCWWQLSGHQLNLDAEHAVRWTVSDEAGIDDLTLVDRTAEEEEEDLQGWLVEIAESVGSSSGDVRVLN